MPTSITPQPVTSMTTRTRLLRILPLAAALFAGGSIVACDTSLTEAPPHIIVAENLYRDLAGFEAGLNGLYALVRRERQGVDGLNVLLAMPMTVGVDNVYANYVSTTERIFNEFGTSRNVPQASIYANVWLWLYQVVNAANTIVSRAASPDVRWTDAEKNRVLGEARLVRAWAYRHLTYLWGPVPLSLEESSGSNIRTDWVRAPVAEVRRQMEEDLLFAETHLPLVARSSGRVSRAVAQHYLAELYLAMGDNARAEAKATALVNSGAYKLITARYGVNASQPGVPFMDQFMDGNANRSEGNTETLWTLQWQQNMPGGGENIMRRYWVNRYYNLSGISVSVENGGRGIGRLSPTRWAINLYGATDDRGSNHAIRKYYIYRGPTYPTGKKFGDTLFLSTGPERIVSSRAPNDPRWPSVRKFDWADPLAPSLDAAYGDQPYLRLADTYLLLAEAQFRQGKLAEAAAAINIVRARANAAPITAASVTLAFILDERSRELLAEEHRRYTLLRTGTWLERTRAHNPLARPNVVARDTLYPIPQVVIDANIGRAMEQNPGY